MKISVLGFSILLSIILSTSALATPPTQILVYKAFNQQSILNEKLIVIQRATGTCWTKSLANPGRPGVWRCMSNNLIMDPCFQDTNTVACIVSPWSNKVSVLELTAPLPSVLNNQINTATSIPWALELENGQRCTFMTGATMLVRSLRVNYGCDQHYSVLGELDRSSSSWKAQFYNYEDQSTKQVAVTRAWF